MKSLFPFLVFVLSFNFSFAQQDTLILKKGSPIVCKVTKITDTDIEYKKTNDVVYIINIDKVKEIRFSDGTSERITPDEMSINKEIEILDRRSTVKFHFFSPLLDQLSFSYERVLKVGTNLEVGTGLINNTMFDFSMSNTHRNYGNNRIIKQGAFVRVGTKFLLGSSYYMKGMKYAHPLKGVFIKPEIVYGGFLASNLQRTYYNSVTGTSSIITSNALVQSVGCFINLGYQSILGNCISLSYSLGAGYSTHHIKYSNPDFNSINNIFYERYNFNYMYSHLRAGSSLSFTGTITIGYIFK